MRAQFIFAAFHKPSDLRKSERSRLSVNRINNHTTLVIQSDDCEESLFIKRRNHEQDEKNCVGRFRQSFSVYLHKTDPGEKRACLILEIVDQLLTTSGTLGTDENAEAQSAANAQTLTNHRTAYPAQLIA